MLNFNFLACFKPELRLDSSLSTAANREKCQRLTVTNAECLWLNSLALMGVFSSGCLSAASNFFSYWKFLKRKNIPNLELN